MGLEPIDFPHQPELKRKLKADHPMIRKIVLVKKTRAISGCGNVYFYEIEGTGHEVCPALEAVLGIPLQPIGVRLEITISEVAKLGQREIL